MTEENGTEDKLTEEEVENANRMMTGAGSWGIVYLLSILLGWSIINGASEKITLWLVGIVTLMWIVKLFERRLSGLHGFEVMKLNLGGK